MKKITKYSNYKNNIFNKLNFDFEKGKKLLDVGCGDCTDIEIFRNEYGLDIYGIDVYKHQNVDKMNIKFKEAGIYNIPYEDKSFDYIFLHDVLHHIDEESQSYKRHIEGLKELKRVVKKDGYIIIIEGNRYNPLFYPHMVKKMGHEHFKQSYFKKIVRDTFNNVEFKNFEAHAYPWGKNFWKIYEIIMNTISPKDFLAYNVAIIKNI